MEAGGRKPRSLFFGQIALKYRYIGLHQLEECLAVQESMIERGEKPKKLGEILVERGHLTVDQARKILELQGWQGGHQQVAGYEVFGPLGNGGMGTVYRARQVSSGKTVALKILLPRLARDLEFVKRFVREARAAAMLDHPSIVAGLDVGESNGLYYFAMEYVAGETLKRLLDREGTIEETRALEIALPIADALAHAAERGIVHGDVKPANIVLPKHGPPKLLDLGLARRANAALQAAAMGTPNYVAPEQVRMETIIDSRADIYSLGATVYHMVTGHHPFYGTTSRILSHQIRTPARTPSELNSHLSAACDRLIRKMLAKRREERFQTPETVVREIRAVLDANAAPPPATSASSVPKRGRKRARRPAASRRSHSDRIRRRIRRR
jgi:serine/threonine-protein kinase